MRLETLFIAMLVASGVSCSERAATKESEDDHDAEEAPKKKKKKRGSEEADSSPSSSATARAPTAPTLPPTSATPSVSVEPAVTAQAPAFGTSFFAGPIPSGVTLMTTRGSALENGALTFALPEGYRGGALPGRDYLATNSDSTVVLRVMTSTAVVSELDCRGLASVLGMAPTKGKAVAQVAPGKLVRVGSGQFVAKEGECSAQSDKGELEIHYLDILRGAGDDAWHYGALVTFPKSAAPSAKDQAMAWARSLQLTGVSGYKL
jgi:hypothetical protein